MGTYARVFRVLLLGCAPALGLPACGGGGGEGGGGPPAEALLAGEYHYVQLTPEAAGSSMRSETGRCTADGNGALTLHAAYAAQEGTSSGPFTPPSRTYSIAADRMLTIRDVAGLTVTGRIRADGGVAALASRGAEVYLSTGVLVRRHVAPTTADLTGEWIRLQFGRSAIPGALVIATLSEMSVGATGAVTIASYTYNLDGQVDPNPSFQIPGNLVPAADGWVEWQRQSDSLIEFRGSLSDDGEVVLLGSYEGFGAYAGIVVLVRKSQGAGAWDLAGSYGSCGMGGIEVPPAFGCFYGPFELNGSGAGTWDSASRAYVADPGEGALPLSYTVASNGLTEVVFLSTVPFRGASTAGGRSVFLTGPYLSGGALPLFQLLVP